MAVRLRDMVDTFVDGYALMSPADFLAGGRQFAGLDVVQSPHLYAGQVYFIKRPKLDLMRDMVIDWRQRPAPRTDDMRQMVEDLAAERWRA